MRSLPLILGFLTVTTVCPAQTQNWVQINPTTSPPARDFQGMAFDFIRQHTVMFGGRSGANLINDTWTWDGKNWTQHTPAVAPSPRWAQAMAYDFPRLQVVLFGGRDGTSITGDTWIWDGTKWTQRNPTTSPPARAFHVMAYDAARLKTVLFGGTTDGSWARSMNDTWEWDGANWTQMKPITSPPAVTVAAMAFDNVRKRMVLFGGGDAAAKAQNQTWEWDGTNWQQILTATTPPVRKYPAMVFDESRQRIVMHGGDRLTDTWQYDGQDWIQILTANAPSARNWIPAMTYDIYRQRSLMFGGSSALADTWEFGGDALTLVSDTDTVSIANGGTQNFTLQPGTTHANRLYWMFGSMTGTAPGVTLTGIHIPLNPDAYTDLVLGIGNSKEFTKFKGTLDAGGRAAASFNVAANLPIPSGFKLNHAFLVYDASSGQIFAASNPAVVVFR